MRLSLLNSTNGGNQSEADQAGSRWGNQWDQYECSLRPRAQAGRSLYLNYTRQQRVKRFSLARTDRTRIHLTRLQFFHYPQKKQTEAVSTRTKTIFFSPVFLGVGSRIFASKRIHWKRLNVLQFIFQAYRWRLKSLFVFILIAKKIHPTLHVVNFVQSLSIPSYNISDCAPCNCGSLPLWRKDSEISWSL